MKELYGIWTPNAETLCLECHGPIINDKDISEDSTWIVMTMPQEIEHWAELVTCNRCGRAIQVQRELAREIHLGKSLSEAGIPSNMEQTGGMNHALAIYCTDGGYYYVTFNLDGDNRWDIGRYDKEGAPVGELFKPLSYSELFRYIKGLTDIDFRKVEA